MTEQQQSTSEFKLKTYSRKRKPERENLAPPNNSDSPGRRNNAHFENLLATTAGLCPSTHDGVKDCPKPKSRQPLVNKRGALNQLHLDLGQANFSCSTCKTCGMVYAQGQAADELLHASYHRNCLQGIRFRGYQSERVILQDGLKGRILLILPHDSPTLNKKVREVCAVMEKQLGLVPGWILHSSCKVFLYVACTKQVTGCLVAEPISSANPVASCSQEEEEVESSFKPTREPDTHASDGFAEGMEGVCTAVGNEATAQTSATMMRLGDSRPGVTSSAVLSEASPSTRCLSLQDDQPEWGLNGSRRVPTFHRSLETGESQTLECSSSAPTLRTCPAPQPRPPGSYSSAARNSMEARVATPSLLRRGEGSQNQRGQPSLKNTPLTRWLKSVKPDRRIGVAKGDHAVGLNVGETSATSWPSHDRMSFGRMLDNSQQGGAPCRERETPCMSRSPSANCKQHDTTQVNAPSEGADQQSCHDAEAQVGGLLVASMLAGGAGGCELPHVEEGLQKYSSRVANPQPVDSAAQTCKSEEDAFAVRYRADADCVRHAFPRPTGGAADSRCPDAQAQQQSVRRRKLQESGPKCPLGTNKLHLGQGHRLGALHTTHETREAHLGVRVIWVARDSQRQGTARKLLDTARCNWMPGYIVPKAKVAFSQPTPDGYKFAAAFVETAQILVYS